jgi:tRNA nucleotidyltransferase (CCA-adding enzyme)
MSRDWEAVFTTWSKGPSDTENRRAENAERQIRQAIVSDHKLSSRNITVFTQGSYRNRVNVRKDSDVDIGILCFDNYFPDYPLDSCTWELNPKISITRQF